MKRSIATNVAVFNTNRMVREYAQVSYLPSHHREAKLTADAYAGAKALAVWRRKLTDQWAQVRVEDVSAPPADAIYAGDRLAVSAKVNLGGLTPADVEVQLYHGAIDSFGEIAAPAVTPLPPVAGKAGTFGTTVDCLASGQYGFSVRVLPKHAMLPHALEPGLVTWG
jgi:starch phosphorylase